MSHLDRFDSEPTSPDRGVVALVLAAGSARRFGGTAKQLAELSGRPLVAHVVATAHAAALGRVVVVVGHEARAVADAAAQGGDVEVVDNPDHVRGQATSLVAGVHAIGADPQARVLVVLLADQPAVDAATIHRVVAAVEHGAVAARARYLDGPGHPVAFSREAWPRLTGVTGDVGARHLLDELGVTEVAVDAPIPADVDTLEDLERLRGPRRDGLP